MDRRKAIEEAVKRQQAEPEGLPDRASLPAITTKVPLEPWNPADRIAWELHQVDRPKLRSDCLSGGPNMFRPCPWLTCKYHLGVDVSDVGSLSVLQGWDDGRMSCALDAAAEDGMTLEDVGALIGVSRERIRQIEQRSAALIKKEHGDSLK